MPFTKEVHSTICYEMVHKGRAFMISLTPVSRKLHRWPYIAQFGERHHWPADWRTHHHAQSDTMQFQALVKAGIDCKLGILGERSLRHRHHGLWYDLRALVTLRLILMVQARTRNLDPKEVGGGSLSELEGVEANSPQRSKCSDLGKMRPLTYDMQERFFNICFSK